MQAEQRRELAAACHCGTVRFRVTLTDGFDSVRRRNCSCGRFPPIARAPDFNQAGTRPFAALALAL
jgi:hypothetical protein